MTGKRTRSLRAGFALGVVSLMALLAACGVPSSDGAEPLPEDISVVGPTSTSPAPVGSATTSVEVAWVDAQDRLQLVPRPVNAQTADERLSAAIGALVVGPIDAELDVGLTTTISSDAELQAELRGRRALIDIVEAGSSRPDPLLPVAQVAVTALSVPGVRSVAFVSDGDRTPVPIPTDPSGVERPLTLRDFGPLLS